MSFCLKRNSIHAEKKFYPRGWANYDTAVRGSLKLIPPDHVLKAMQKDYVALHIHMFTMIRTTATHLIMMTILDKPRCLIFLLITLQTAVLGCSTNKITNGPIEDHGCINDFVDTYTEAFEEKEVANEVNS